MTRLALSSVELWRSILATNKAQVSEALEVYLKVLNELKNALGEREIAYTFDQARSFAETVRKSPLP
jgi:prephenate dehydrogenase